MLSLLYQGKIDKRRWSAASIYIKIKEILLLDIISLVTLKTILQNDLNIQSVIIVWHRNVFVAFSFFVKEKTEKSWG